LHRAEGPAQVNVEGFLQRAHGPEGYRHVLHACIIIKL